MSASDGDGEGKVKVNGAAPAPAPIVVDWPPPVAIALRRRPAQRTWSNALLVVLTAVLPSTLLPVGWFFADGTLSVNTALAILGGVGALSIAWLFWLFWLPKPGPITLDAGVLTVPHGRRARRFVIAELVLCRATGRKGRDLHLVTMVRPGVTAAGEIGAIVVPGRCFADEDGARQVRAAVDASYDAIPAPYGPGFRQRLDENAAQQQAFIQKRPVLTWALTAVCVLIFGAQWAAGAVTSLPRAIAFGANLPPDVADGALWRLVTANLLHGSLVHLAMNMAGLLSLGRVLERSLGRPALATALIVSGVVGQGVSAARSVMLGPPFSISVGISGAIFGLLGVLLTSTLLQRRHGGGGLRVPASAWLLLLVANGALSAIPMVDVSAHVGGFVAGAVVGFLVLRRPRGPAAADGAPRPFGAPLEGTPLRRLSLGLTALVVLATLYGAWQGVSALSA